MKFENFNPEWEGRSAELWRHRFSDWATLVAEHTPQTAYVAIDFEGDSRKRRSCLRGVSEMGIAVIPPPVLQKPQTSRELLYGDNGDGDRAHNPAAFPVPSMDTKTLLEDTEIESYTFCIHERAEGSSRKEKTVLSKTAWFDENEVEEKLDAFLASVHDRFNTEYAKKLTGFAGQKEGDSPIRMVLVGWSMGTECMVLCSRLPQAVLSGHLSVWCDLDDLVIQTLGEASSMTEVIMALGYPFGALVPRGRKTSHRAGNDVIRVLVILLHMLNFYQTTGTIPPRVPPVYRKKRRSSNDDGPERHQDAKPKETTADSKETTWASTSTQETQGSFLLHPFQHPMRPLRMAKPKEDQPGLCRPSPFTDYPFTVFLCLRNRKSMRNVARDYKVLHAMFAEYKPVTTSMRCTKEMAWICLPDEETRNRFIADTHRTERFGVIWIAHALSPRVYGFGTHPRKEQRALREDMRLPGNENLQSEQQAKRRAWREVVKDDGGEEALSLGMDLLNIEDEW